MTTTSPTPGSRSRGLSRFDAALGIVQAHDIATAAQHTLLHEVPKLVAATVHVSPRATVGHDHHAELAHHLAALEPGAITR